MDSRRRERSIGFPAAAGVMILSVGLALTSVFVATKFVEASQDWIVEPDCANITATPYYFAEGPIAYWHAYADQSAPNHCEYWTDTVFSYSNTNYDNTSYWYLPNDAGGGVGDSGNFSAWPFEPAPNAFTRFANYEFWPYGHQRTEPDRICTFSQSTYGLEVWAQLCGQSNRNQTFYFCASNNSGCGGFVRLTDATGESSSVAIASATFSYCLNSGGPCSTTQGYSDDYHSNLGMRMNNLYNFRCLDADLGTIGSNGTKVQLWDCHSDTDTRLNQNWNWITDGITNSAKIVNGTSGRCLDADLGTIGSNGTKVQLWDCIAGARNQEWVFHSDWSLSNVYSGRCLDADLGTIGSNGTKIQLWDCSTPEHTNRQWAMP